MARLAQILVVAALLSSCVQMERPEDRDVSSAAAGRVVMVHRLGLGPGDLLLESIQKFISDNEIRDGAVLTGIGSLSECTIHWPARPEYPPTDKFATFEGALEITSIQGVIADGEPHLHMMVAEGGDARAIGGHLEKGCKVLYLAEITVAELDGPAMTRRPNQHDVRMLERK